MDAVEALVSCNDTLAVLTGMAASIQLGESLAPILMAIHRSSNLRPQLGALAVVCIAHGVRTGAAALRWREAARGKGGPS